MERRFRHVTAATTAALLIAGPGTVSAANAASAPVDGPTTARIGLAVAAADADPAGLERFATAVSDPGRPLYRHFLAPARVRVRFGPKTGQLKKVHSWVADGGLRITSENSHGIDVAGTSAEISRAFGHLPQRRMSAGVDCAAQAASAVPAALAGTVSSVAKLVPEKHGMRQSSYRVAAGPRQRVLSGGGVDPGGPVQPAEPATPGAQAERGGPVQQSAGAMPPSTQVNPGGLMQPGGPEMPADPVRVLAPQVNPGGPMQPAGPLRPVILGGPARRALPADRVDPTPPTVTSTACSTDWGRSPAFGLPPGSPVAVSYPLRAANHQAAATDHQR